MTCIENTRSYCTHNFPSRASKTADAREHLPRQPPNQMRRYHLVLRGAAACQTQKKRRRNRKRYMNSRKGRKPQKRGLTCQGRKDQPFGSHGFTRLVHVRGQRAGLCKHLQQSFFSSPFWSTRDVVARSLVDRKPNRGSEGGSPGDWNGI